MIYKEIYGPLLTVDYSLQTIEREKQSRAS